MSYNFKVTIPKCLRMNSPQLYSSRIHSSSHSDPKVLVSPLTYVSEVMSKKSKFSHMKLEMKAQFLSRSHEMNQIPRI